MSNVQVSVNTTLAHYYIGENIAFICKATGRPKPQFSWFYNDNSISSRGRVSIFFEPTGSDIDYTSVLAISNLMRSDAGVYKIQVKDTIRDVVITSQYTVGKFYLYRMHGIYSYRYALQKY